MNLDFVPDLTSSDTFSQAAVTSFGNGSAVSPLTATCTLPGNGMYLVAVTYYLQGSIDHMLNALYEVRYVNAGSNKTLTTTLIGSVGFSAGSSFGLSAASLALSNPTSAGVLTATAAWANGGAHTASGAFYVRRMTAL